MSPVGMPETPDHYDLEKIKKNLDGYFEKKGLETIDWIWNSVHPAPFDGSRALGRIVKPIIKASLERRLGEMPDGVIDIFTNYVH